MYIVMESGKVFMHAEPYDKFLWLARQREGKTALEQYLPQKGWHFDKYDVAELWLREHAAAWGYKVVEDE